MGAAAAAKAGQQGDCRDKEQPPLRRYIALISGQLPETSEHGEYGPAYRCSIPLRELGTSAKTSETSAKHCPDPTDGGCADSVDQACENEGRRQRPPKLAAVTDFETLCTF